MINCVKETKKILQKTDGICVICKKEFNPRSITHLTCSTICRTYLNKNRQTKWVDETKNKIRNNIIAKKCSRCKEVLLITEFNKQNSKLDSYAPHCKSCINTHKKMKYASDPNVSQKSRNIHFKSSYGITLEKYDQLFLEQNGCCAICTKHQSNFKKRLSVDHCHKTGKFRGLLCQFCNTSLGNFDDRIDLLLKAVEYLKKNNFEIEV